MAISIGDAVLEIGVDKGDFDRDMKGLGASIKKHQKAIGVGMTAMGATILTGLGLSLKAAGDFEGAMREVNTMMGLADEEFTDFSKQVQTLASDLGVDAVESANALYQAISAGIPKENVLEFLEIATKAAIGGVTDTETAVDGLTTVINAFKLPMSDAQKVADLMFTTVKGVKTTFEELSASLFQVAPIAAASGVSFEETAAALATMTKQGVPTKVATTQLRQAMVALQKPTADLDKVIKDLGFESGQTMLEELGLAETLNTLRDATGGSNEQLMKMFGSVEAGAAVLALTGDNAQTFATDLEAMANAEGAAIDAFEEMEKGASRQMEALKNSFKGIAISVGTVLLPILKDLVGSVKPIIENIKNWMAENPGLTKTIIIAVGAIGGLLAVLGPLLIMLPAIIAGFSLLLGPVGLVILGITALIAIGILLWKNWDKISEMAKKIWGTITKFFKDTWKTITGFFQEHWDKILAILFPAIGLPILIARNWGAIVTEIKRIWNTAIEWLKGVPPRIGAIFLTVTDWILNPFRAALLGMEKGINWLIRQINKIRFEMPDWVPGIGGKKFGINIPEISLPTFKHGGIIPEPTLLTSLRTMKPYAIAGEAGAERVSPMGAGQMMTIIQQIDGREISRTVMPYVVGEIRLRTGVHI